MEKKLVPHTNQTILQFVKKDSNESVKLPQLKFSFLRGAVYVDVNEHHNLIL